MAFASDLISRLRQRVKDERVGRVAFRLLCDDPSATDCLVSVTEAGLLTVRPLNARRATTVSVDLSDPSYGTVRLLFDYLASMPGYQVVAERDMVDSWPSMDLRLVGELSCRAQAVALRHHMFSDEELLSITDDAARQHNVNYTAVTVPEEEGSFVLQLSEVICLRRLAQDSSRRRNLEFTTDQLIALADSLRADYDATVLRQRRALPVPTTLDEGTSGTKDIVVTSAYRRRPRWGAASPVAAAQPMHAPMLNDPAASDVEDVAVRLSWERPRDSQFYALELWRDTRPGIERPVSFAHSITDAMAVQRLTERRAYTARLCFRTTAPASGTNRVATVRNPARDDGALPGRGQLVSSFVDVGYTTMGGTEAFGPDTAPPLEPVTTYYYKLFAVSNTGEVSESREVTATTLAARARFDKDAPFDVLSGPAGTLVTAAGVNFHAGMTLTIGGKAVGSLTVVSATSITFTVPTFLNDASKDILHDVVLTSSTGLLDVITNGFTVSSS